MNSYNIYGADGMKWCIVRLSQSTNSPHDRLLELVLVLVICCIVELLKVNIRPRAMFAIYIIFEVIINNHAISLSCYDLSNLWQSKHQTLHCYIFLPMLVAKNEFGQNESSNYQFMISFTSKLWFYIIPGFGPNSESRPKSWPIAFSELPPWPIGSQQGLFLGQWGECLGVWAKNAS